MVLQYARVLVVKDRARLAVAMVFGVFALIYILVLLTDRPAILLQTELFSPYRFSLNAIIPSLGHLFLLSILAAVFSGFCFLHYPVSEREGKERAKDYLFLTSLLIAGALLISVFHLIFSELISTSNINFEAFKVLDLSIFSAIGFVAVFLLLLFPVFFLMKIFRSITALPVSVVLVSIFSSIGIIVVIWHRDAGTFVPLSLFYLLLTISIWLTYRANMGFFNMTVIFSLIFGLYSLFFIITNCLRSKLQKILKYKLLHYLQKMTPKLNNFFSTCGPIYQKIMFLEL